MGWNECDMTTVVKNLVTFAISYHVFLPQPEHLNMRSTVMEFTERLLKQNKKINASQNLQ